ncbi:MAG: family 43 glycosylhydrolase, partial [Spirosomaceae bacterium]|nr:family 43 glycosylhydrolase [Spirosomataceae bacterium]
NPYKKTGFGMAVSDKIDGDYTLLNPKEPLLDCNQATLIADKSNRQFIVYEMDGRFYSAEIDLKKGKLTSEPKEFLGPGSMGSEYKYLDAPQFYVRDGKYHLTFSQFYGGYEVKVFHYVADDLFAKYHPVEAEPLYTWLEAEASENVQMRYPVRNGFAPPTQVIFSNQIVELQKGNFGMVYHSSEKYAEPALCIDPFTWVGDSIKINFPKAAFQGLNQRTTARFVSTNG